MWYIEFSSQARKDAKYLKAAHLDTKAKALIELLRADPFAKPPRYEALVGNLSGYCSRRINIQHRLVYLVCQEPFTSNGAHYEGRVKVLRMWTHYDGISS
jgi:toxin YoeB